MNKVICNTPAKGKQSTRIDKWKYDLVHEAILAVVPSTGEGVLFKELAGLVRAQLAAEDLAKLGSVSWYTVSVKLHMETTGELVRLPKAKPQRLLRVGQ